MPRVSVFSHSVIDCCQILYISDSYEPSVRTFGVAVVRKVPIATATNIPRVMSNIDHDVRSRRCKLVLSRHCLWLPFGRAHKRGHPKVSEAAIVGYRHDIKGKASTPT